MHLAGYNSVFVDKFQAQIVIQRKTSYSYVNSLYNSNMVHNSAWYST